MTADKLWDLLSRKISGEANEAELNEFDEVLLVHPEWKDTTDIFIHLWKQPVPFANTEAEHSFDRHVERMRRIGIEFNEYQHINEPEIIWEDERDNKKRKVRRWVYSLAGIAMLVAGYFVVSSTTGSAEANHNPSPLSQVSTKPGSKTQIQLPDGSTVWLNASSNLTYDKEFGKVSREVTLTGEAFFDVVKDASHPFIIHTKVIDVKVLGTQFNVRSYPNDANTETSLIKGSVEVTVKNRNEKFYLKPNEKVVIANNIADDVKSADKLVTKKHNVSKPLISIQSLNYYLVDSTILETSWVDNRLIFQKNESFREIALKMERRYSVNITFASEKVAEYRPFGSFTTETITQALDALKEGFRFNYKKDGDNIVITE